LFLPFRYVFGIPPFRSMAVMDIPRRENFRSWFGEVGYLYLVVILIVALAFLFRDLKMNPPSLQRDAVNTQKVAPTYDEGG